MLADNLMRSVPYYINNAFGDPFTANQINSTLSKVHELIDVKNYFSVCSKADINREISSELVKISKYDTSGMFLGYSLTGLNEGGIDRKDRVSSIRFLFETFGRVLISARPMIYGRNMTLYQDVRKSQPCKASMLKKINEDWRCAIGCVLYTSGKYLMVHKKTTSDVTIPDFQASWDLLKGGCHPGESPEHTVHRELNEELGLSTKNIERMEFMDERIAFAFPENSNYKGQITQMAMVRLKEGSASGIVIDERELDSIKFVTYQDLIEQIRLPETQEFLIRNQDIIQTFFGDSTNDKQKG